MITRSSDPWSLLRPRGLLLLTLSIGCNTAHTPGEVDRYLSLATEAAKLHQERKEDVEAAQLVEAVLLVDPTHQGASEIRASLSGTFESLYSHPLLGSNFSIRPSVERSLGAKVLLYLPDRILDLLDVFSFDVGIGLGLFFNVHLTRAAQLGLGGRGTAGVGWHDHRSLGGLAQAESGVALSAVGAQAFAGALAGTSGVRVLTSPTAGLHRPSQRIYQRFRDYWAIGVAATLIDVGIDVDIHPLEIADFGAGIFGMDFLHDDFARTRRLRLGGSERQYLIQLYEIQRSEETMAAFRAAHESEN